MDKKGQVDGEIFMNIGFWILLGVGYMAFAIMLFVLKGMDNSDIMPMWVKIVTIIIIPLAAYAFTLVNSQG